MKYLASILLTAMIVPLAPTTAAASEIPWSMEPFSYYANDERVSEIITHMAGLQGIPVIFKGKVDETISASFRNTTRQEIFRQLVKVYDLHWFYDGHILYVDRVDNAAVESIRLHTVSVEEFKAYLIDLGVLNDRFYWRAAPSEGIVVVGGPEEFLRRVRELAEMVDTGQRSFDTVYKWNDKNGLTHFSSDRGAAPHGADVLRVRRGSGIEFERTDRQKTTRDAGGTAEIRRTLTEVAAKIQRQVESGAEPITGER
ncbi:MAG: secretin N-terminal domain-containing protein [Aquisalimonadaceae bacterium]